MPSEKTRPISTNNPRRNLPLQSRRKRTESNFQSLFIRTFFLEPKQKGLGGSQFELPGFGIADYVWVSPDASIDAFEFKMENWKKGATQAARYRSYASRAFLVIPDSISSRALKHIDFFQTIGLGLWTFDSKEKRLTRHYTPDPSEALNLSAKLKALNILKQKSKFRDLLECDQRAP